MKPLGGDVCKEVDPTLHAQVIFQGSVSSKDRFTRFRPLPVTGPRKGVGVSSSEKRGYPAVHRLGMGIKSP